jgi:hypothetical protein
MNTQINSAGDNLVVFRGQDETSASSNAFVGSWLDGGINRFSAYLRHDAPVPLPFFARFATPSNFPGVGADNGLIVQPNTWTKIEFDITPAQINSTLFPEGPSSFYNSVFGNLGHVQFGFDVPAALAGNATNYTYGLDQVSVASIPEPASCLLAIGMAAASLMRRQRRETK